VGCSGGLAASSERVAAIGGAGGNLCEEKSAKFLDGKAVARKYCRPAVAAATPTEQVKMRCLVIEDEADTARYISNGLKEAGHAVTLVRDGAEGLHLAANEHWDVIVLDRLLPGGVDGLSIIATIRGLGKTTPVLILSALASLDERVRGLRSGGDDYLTKPFAFSELLARIEVLLRRGTLREDNRELQIADLKLDLRTRRAERSGRPIALQPREFRLLEYLVRHRDQVVTRTMLLEGVWDYYFDPQTNVIDVQISRLRRKIDKDFSPQLLHTIRGIGYMISADE
jgi:two-component system, OmpR family, response regulator